LRQCYQSYWFWLNIEACKHCGKSTGDIINNHPMSDQWDSELEKLSPRKSSRWGSSPDSTNEQGSL